MDFVKILIVILVALIPALFWLLIFYKKDYKDFESKKIILETFVAGLLIGFPFLFIKYILIKLNLDHIIIFEKSISILIFAILEEIAKLSAAVFVINHHKIKFNQIIDGVMYLIVASLGFSFIENIIYFSSFLNQMHSINEFLNIMTIRSFGVMFAHILFSSLLGLIWAYAYFSKKITPFQKKHILAFEIKDLFNKEILTLHIIRNNILKNQASRRGGHEKKILVFEGICLASFLHIIFNFSTELSILGKNISFILIPFLMIGFFYIKYLFHIKLNKKIIKVI